MSDSEEFSGSEDEKFRFKPAFDLCELPAEVIKRVKALKNLQYANIKHEVDYYNEIHKLDLKYKKLYDENNEKRKHIYLGSYEPSEMECAWKDDGGDIVGDIKKLEIKEKTEESIKGIPNFWLTVFQNVNDCLLNGMFEKIDEPIFKHLEDITITLPEKNTGFSLNFFFSPNEFFTNSVLTKSYEMKSDIDPEDPLDFDGPEMSQSKGCKIDWKSGKNPTVKVIKQKVKQKGKGKGGPKFVTKQQKRETFFNFFTPPRIPEDPNEEISEEIQGFITEDFHIGLCIQEKLIPRGILYFTGEALEDEEDDFEDLTGDEDEDEDDEEDMD
eukprot:GFUD01009024.1.p1 GENE.GFUD01009024.1~~GFUD01009024.1.p1  ORF type:complete len:327 (+),score=132.37 GFUD01009024.1:169-1149(+)